ncbi:hypothetical protein AMK01_CH01083 [Rhizobium sp. N6212]|nr:hypothetical protein AMK02_CH01098 [Rhizobium sp. N731]ANK90591.1 hypothetical protein AMK01_CH01083 [Rhizobium sp. N6212]ANK96620.1 hypothetical protein AMK00_CH01085 [Rhizobium sp. N621]ANL02741.1 hypothetical protein AMJ99_CH01154 [Rhizobium esperanzae]ANL08790.1 hypothetical protein AMJ98_CH01075 [Rhizobium sp. N1341]ANL14980.1 hypothetical protein AMJ97_CH01098 [Rhizobium sp. N1314]ANM33593.1 hypothetical protein AMK04_CH01155 [Rhizobium sp. N871]ANM39631.1 hypothetical protein AMK03
MRTCYGAGSVNSATRKAGRDCGFSDIEACASSSAPAGKFVLTSVMLSFCNLFVLFVIARRRLASYPATSLIWEGQVATDIKLDHGADQDTVKIEAGALRIQADVVKTTASDFLIDCPPRRSNKGGPYRRALVHGEDDSLIVNFLGDYPGGTRIADAKLNLRLEQQNGGEPLLPKDAPVGTLHLVQSVISGSGSESGFTDYEPGPVRLFICVGRDQTEEQAYWSEVQLGEPILGSE